jgi:hypothetical protein
MSSDSRVPFSFSVLQMRSTVSEDYWRKFDQSVVHGWAFTTVLRLDSLAKLPNRLFIAVHAPLERPRLVILHARLVRSWLSRLDVDTTLLSRKPPIPVAVPVHSKRIIPHRGLVDLCVKVILLLVVTLIQPANIGRETGSERRIHHMIDSYRVIVSRRNREWLMEGAED